MKSVAAQIKGKLCRVCAAPASGVVVGRYARTPVCDRCGEREQGKGKQVEFVSPQRRLGLK